jgi:hypothetical protein
MNIGIRGSGYECRAICHCDSKVSTIAPLTGMTSNKKWLLRRCKGAALFHRACHIDRQKPRTHLAQIFDPLSRMATIQFHKIVRYLGFAATVIADCFSDDLGK